MIGSTGSGIERRGSLFEELSAAVGEEAARKLVEAFGGARLYVPLSTASAEGLNRVIGPAAAAQLVQTFGGDRVEVPRPPSRRARIEGLRRQGLGVDAIALAAGCTRRRVFQVLAEQRAAGRAALKRAARERDGGPAGLRVSNAEVSGAETFGSVPNVDGYDYRRYSDPFEGER